MARTANKKQKVTHQDLINTPELRGSEKLRVFQLEELQKQARAEFKKRDISLVKRIGHTALDGIAATHLFVSNPKVAKKAFEDSFNGFHGSPAETSKPTHEKVKLNRLGGFAARLSLNRLDKRYEREAKRNEKWQESHEKVEADYRKSNPDIGEREAVLHDEARQRAYEDQRGRTVFDAYSRNKYVMGYFAEGNTYSFSKSIPRRKDRFDKPGFDGSYLDLAKNTLKDALSHKKEDGSVPLLGIETSRQRVAEQENAGTSLGQINADSREHVQGVSAALWQMGFVEFKEERLIDYGKGNFNEDIQWAKDNDSLTAQLPYDPGNELHGMLMPEESGFANPMIEVEMGMANTMYGREPYSMDMRVVDAPVLEAVAA